MKRVIAAIMCIAILVSMCVFTASATEIVEVKNAEELRNALTGKSGVIVKLTQDIVLNDELGLAYSNGVITVTNGKGAVAKIETGENGTTIGKIADGSLDSLNKWTPLANLNGNTIDGAGHKIVGMVVTVSGGSHGAFAQKIQKGESVKDLTFENSLVISAKATKAATAVCDLCGDLFNVNAKNSYVVASEVSKYGHAGGLVDTTNSTFEPQNELYNPTVKDCSFDGLVAAANGDASYFVSAGGVVAQNVGGKIVNCVNYGKVVTVNGNAYGLGGVVGIVEPTFQGLTDKDTYKTKGIRNAYVINCANYGEISKSAGKAPGGVIGFIDPTWSTGEDIIVGNLYNAGIAKEGSAIIANCGGVNNFAKAGTFEFKNAFADKDVLATTGTPSSVFQAENIKALSVDEALAELNKYAALYSASFGAYGWSKVEGKLLPDPKAEIKPYDGGEKLEITGVKVLNDRELEITFSGNAKKVANAYSGIRYTNDQMGLQYDDKTPLQFDCGLRLNGSNKAIAKLHDKYTGVITMAEIFAFKGYETKGYKLYYCIEEATENDPSYTSSVSAAAKVDSITSPNGLVLLEANKPNKNNPFYDGVYTEITDQQNASVKFTTDTALPEAAPQIEANMTPTEGGITIKSVKAINATQLEITFSEPVKKASDFFNGIRYVDKNLALQTDPAYISTGNDRGYLQFMGSPVFNGTNKVVWTFTALADGRTLYDILTLKGYENKGYFVTFCIEGLNKNNVVPNPQPGFVDNITSLDGTKLLSANVAKKDGVYDDYYTLIEDIEKAKGSSQPQGEIEADMTPTEGGITIKSVKAINETQLEITFSEPVKKHSSVFSAVRYVDKNLSLGKDESLGDPNLQFLGSLKFDDTEKVIWTYNSVGLYDILKLVGYEDKGYFVTFCIEGLNQNNAVPNPQPGFIDNITSLDGTKLLSCTVSKKDNKSGIFDGYYSFIEDIEKAKGEDKPPVAVEGIEVLSAKVLNEREIEFTFSEQVQLVGSVFSGIRYTDASYNLRTDDTLPTVDNRLDKYLQFTGSLRMNGSNKAIFKLGNDGKGKEEDNYKATKGKTLDQILKFDGYEDKGYKLYFCFEGLKAATLIRDPREGYVDNIQNDDGTKRLVANKPNKDCIFDGCYVEITDLENATKKFTTDTKLPAAPQKPIDPSVLKTPEDGIKVLSAKIINASQIELTFSENVKMVGSAFAAVRYVDSTLKLGRDESREDPNLQWWGSLGLTGTNNKGVWTINSGLGTTLENVMKFKGYEDCGYYLMFCIEGLKSAAITNPKPGYVDNITSTNGKKLLGANKKNDAGVFDGVYVEITGMENIKKKAGLLPIKNRPNFTLKSCKVINSQQIEFIFSEPVKKESSVFAAIRYTNNDMVVQKDGDTYLQFSGSLKFNDTERVVWTVSSTGGKTLYELLTLKGYEKSGYKVYFCFEGLPTKTAEVGYIDNITSLDGKKLLKCTEERASSNGTYDGLYVKIADIDKANVEGGDGKLVEGITVENIVALDDYKLELTFSDPIYLVGSGTSATQYNPVLAAVRYVDPVTYEPVKHNDKKLEFAADFYANDGELTAEFELRSKETTLRDLFAKVGYEDVEAIPMLVLQGTDDEDGIFDLPLKGFVDNIQSQDGKKMLVAMKEADDGISDAWFAEREEINFEGKPSEEKELLKLVNKDKMTEAQKAAYAKLSEEEVTAKLAEAKSKIDAMSKTLSESGEKAFNTLLKKNKIDNPESVKAFKFSTEPMALDFPVKLNIDVKDRGYGLNDKLYVYRVDENGKVEAVDTNMYSSFASDGAIGRIEVYTDKLGDFFVTNAPLEVSDKAGIPVFVWAIIGGVIVLAGAAVGIVAAGKKKKATK